MMLFKVFFPVFFFDSFFFFFFFLHIFFLENKYHPKSHIDITSINPCQYLRKWKENMHTDYRVQKV